MRCGARPRRSIVVHQGTGVALYRVALAYLGSAADLLLAYILIIVSFLLCGLAVAAGRFAGFAMHGNPTMGIIFGCLLLLIVGALRYARSTGYEVGHTQGRQGQPAASA